MNATVLLTFNLKENVDYANLFLEFNACFMVELTINRYILTQNRVVAFLIGVKRKLLYSTFFFWRYRLFDVYELND